MNQEIKGTVYLLKCNICDFSYVGSTRCELKCRFDNHKSHSKSKKTKLYAHMNSCGVNNFSIEPLEIISFNNICELRKLEDYYICLKKPQLNQIHAYIGDIHQYRFNYEKKRNANPERKKYKLQWAREKNLRKKFLKSLPVGLLD